MGYTETPQSSKYARCWHHRQPHPGWGRKSNSSQRPPGKRPSIPRPHRAAPRRLRWRPWTGKGCSPLTMGPAPLLPREGCSPPGTSRSRQGLGTQHTPGSRGAAPAPPPRPNTPPGSQLLSQIIAEQGTGHPLPRAGRPPGSCLSIASISPFRCNLFKGSRWVLAGRRCEGRRAGCLPGALPISLSQGMEKEEDEALRSPAWLGCQPQTRSPFWPGELAAGQGRMA